MLGFLLLGFPQRVFAHLIEDSRREKTPTALRAKNKTKEQLLQFVLK